MKLLVRLLSITLLVAVAASSCKSKKSGPLGLIPKDASIVVSINAGQLMAKMAKDGLSIDRIMTALESGKMDSAAPAAAAFWDDAKNTGIDFTQPAYMSLHIPSGVQSRHAPVRIIFSIADGNAFEAYLKKNGAESKKENGITYALLDESVIGHNGKTALYVSAMNADALTGLNTRGSAYNPDSDEDAGSFSADSARKEIARSFNLKTDEAVSSLNNFDEMPLAGNDMRIWMNYENGITSMMRGDLATVALLMEKLLQGGSMASTLNFENGKIAVQSRMYFNKNAADTIMLSPARSLDLSLLDKFPGSSLNALMGMALEPQMLKDLLKFLQLDGAARFGMAAAGIAPDDVFNALSGDILLVASDFKLPPLNELMAANPDGTSNFFAKYTNLALLAKIKDRQLLEKILTSKMVAQLVKQEGNNYVLTQGTDRLLINIQGPVMILSASQALIDQYNAGTAKPGFDAATLGRYKDKSIGFYLNMQSILQGLPPELRNAEFAKEQQVMGLGSAFKEIYMTAGKFTGNYIQSEGAIVLNDSSRNSLSGMLRMAVGTFVMIMGGGEPETELPGTEDDRLKPMDIKPLVTPDEPAATEKK